MDERLERAKTVVFDVGNVLLRFDPHVIADALLPEDVREPLYHAMFKEHRWAEFDEGRRSNRAIALDIAAAAGLPEAAADNVLHVLDHFHECLWELPLVKELPVLKQMGKKLYALTNYPMPAFTYASQRFTFFRLFDGWVVSAVVQQVKPHAAIFETLMNTYHFEAKDALFVDDMAANVATAKELGFETWQYSWK